MYLLIGILQLDHTRVILLKRTNIILKAVCGNRFCLLHIYNLKDYTYSTVLACNARSTGILLTHNDISISIEIATDNGVKLQ